jgi:hypothetical protein
MLFQLYLYVTETLSLEFYKRAPTVLDLNLEFLKIFNLYKTMESILAFSFSKGS